MDDSETSTAGASWQCYRGGLQHIFPKDATTDLRPVTEPVLSWEPRCRWRIRKSIKDENSVNGDGNSICGTHGLSLYRESPPRLIGLFRICLGNLDEYVEPTADDTDYPDYRHLTHVLQWQAFAENRTARHLEEQSIDTAVIQIPTPSEEMAMDKDRIKGSAEQAKGTVKQAAGKAFGDKKLEAEGKTEKAAGKLEKAVGGLKDAVRGK
jgi:uncharacterized protein YjbJ (UPF0337 family)